MQTVLFSNAMPYKAYTLHFKAGCKKFKAPAEHAVVFIYKGEIQFFLKPYAHTIISQGQVFILPRDAVSQFLCVSDASATVIEVPDITVIATYFLNDTDPVYKPTKDWLKPIFMDRILTSFHNTINSYIKDSKLPGGLIRVKIFELFYVIHKSQDSDIQDAFFAPIVSDGYEFARFVFSNYQQVKNAEELAGLSNYSLSGFEKQFRKVFGTAPYKWMLQQKAELVFREIILGNKPLKVIADEFDFCNISHLGDFCRKYFGQSPSALRDKNKL